MNSAPSFVLSLFGSPRITDVSGTPLAGRAVQRHRIALLALLATSRHGACTRDKLMAYLWPERDADHARQLLNQAVYHLRRALGEDAIVTAGDELRLDPTVVAVDVAEFENALDEQDPARAVARYTGPFLDGFFLSDSPEFERWVDQERDRLSGRYAKALETLAENAAAGGDMAAAAAWWKARAAHDPYDSRVALRLMEALARAGQAAAALKHARIHGQLLEDEFGTAPPSELLALAERLRAAPADTGPGTAQSDPPRAQPVAASAPPASSEPAGPVAGSASALPAAVPRARRRLVRWAAIVVGAASIVAAAAYLRNRAETRAPLEAPLAVVVLPLANRSGPADGALVDGMTEALIGALARTGALRVIASTTAFGFRNNHSDVRAIADSLGAAYVVEGGVQRVAERLRVELRLIDPRDGTTRWSDSYDSELKDIFTLQDEIAHSVVAQLGVRLANGYATPRAPSHTRNVAAYELYLRGSDQTLLRSDSAALNAVSYLRQAIALDSSYAVAWAVLARLYGRAGTPEQPRMPMRERLRLAERTARRALELDDSLAEGHATLGGILTTMGDFAGAEHHLLRAVELDPAFAFAHEKLVSLYIWRERPLQALSHARLALNLEPLSPTAHAELARALLFNDRCAEALTVLEKVADLQPPLPRAVPTQAQCFVRLQRWTEAIDLLESRRQIGAGVDAQLAYTLGRAGRTTEARRMLHTIAEQYGNGARSAFHVAAVHAGLGDRDTAFAWLQRAAEDGSLTENIGNSFNQAIMGPLFEEWRRDPRFQRVRDALSQRKP